MKIGDKLLCKKDIVSFNEGEFYIVDDIASDGVHLLFDNQPNGWWFAWENDEVNFLDNLYDYFYTEKEVRKLKLHKLNKI